LGDQDSDFPIIDTICHRFEVMSGQILNRNRKSAVLSLGTWAGRQDWPLDWLSAPPTLKVFSVTFGPTLEATIEASWAATAKAATAAINMWVSHRLPTLTMKKIALETFVFPKLWYLAQILPLPTPVAQKLAAAAGNFLWKGCLERLAWSELHFPRKERGLGLSCLQTRAQTLLAKQVCWAISPGGQAAQLWQFWLGGTLQHHFPQLAAGQHAQQLPRQWRNLAEVLTELVVFSTVDPAALESVTAAGLYTAFMDTPQPPKVVLKRPELPWNVIWARLARQPAAATEADTTFRLLHGILPLRGRRLRFGLPDEDGACPHCPGEIETALHLFTRVQDAWPPLVAALLPFVGPQADETLLYLAWPPGNSDSNVVMVMLTYIHMVWTERGRRRRQQWRP
jgi:hypothetical protein